MRVLLPLERPVRGRPRRSTLIARSLTELRHGRIPGRPVVRVLAMLWIIRLALWCVPFVILRRHLDTRRDAWKQRRPTSQRGDLSRVARRIDLAGRFVPYCTCLVRALVAEQLLAESGHASVVRFGVAGTSDNRFSAHAWVECEGRVIVGGDVTGFVALGRAGPLLPLR